MVTNPKGAPKLPPELKAARELNQRELERIINTLLHLSRNQLVQRLKDPKLTMIERIAARILQASESVADEKRLGFILDRMLGKPKERVEHSGPNGAPIASVIMSPEERLAEIKRLQDLREAVGDD